MHLHQIIHITPFPVSCISVHRFSLFSVSLFFHNHKKIQYIQGELYTMSHVHVHEHYDVNFLDLALEPHPILLKCDC